MEELEEDAAEENGLSDRHYPATFIPPLTLTGYLDDGDYLIDNNLVENSIRIPAVGRRRWLFIGHPDAGWRSAVIYSLIVSCRRRGINPQEYLTDILHRLPGLTINQLDSLLPQNWKPPSATSPAPS